MTETTARNASGLAPELREIGARFDHVAVAARRFDDLLPLYRDALGGTVTRATENVPLGFQTMHVVYADGRHIELIQPSPRSDFLEGFLDRTGGRGGVHHITFRVEDVAGAVARLQAAGYPTFGERLDDPYHCEAFVHPREAHGVLLQVSSFGTTVPENGSAAFSRWRSVDHS